MDILQQDVEVVVNTSADITASTDIDINKVDTPELDISFDNNEYSIVGDDMVVVTKYNEAPQWLKDTIDNIVNIKTAVAVGDLNTIKGSLDVMLGELEVAKNTYQLSIISSDDINQRITTAITTLNSSLQAADATILNIANTAVTPSEASAIALNTLSASLSSNGEIGSAIHNLQTAMTTLQNTTATDISYLESTMQGEVEGNAQAMHVIRTYVGIDDNGVANNTGLLSDIKILQKQSDGIIETITGMYDVMINPQDPNLAELVVTAEPYASWKAADVTGMDTRLSHIGDVYIKYSITSNGAKQYIGSYKFIRTVVDVTDTHHSTDADGFTWALIVDQAAQDAYTQALNAYDLADGKITSYYMDTKAAVDAMSNGWTAAQKSSNVGDLAVVWNDSTLDNNGTWRWNGSSWISARDKKLTAVASDVTTLHTDLVNEANVRATADSTVTNNLTTVITDKTAAVESKWTYGSSLTLNGTTYTSGFGMSNSAGTGAGSEFWVNADKFKFTNNGKTGATAPFTIDASGTTPQITFNGKVSFTNVTGTKGTGNNLLYNSAPKLGSETKGWSIGWSNHGLSSSIGAGFSPWLPTGGASVYVAVPGNPGIGTVFDINNTRFSVIANQRYEASAYVSSHRCNSYVTLAWFDNNGNYISEIGGSSVTGASSGPLGNWSRTTLFATAPSNAATAQFYVRSSVTSDNPYCFVAYAYAGVASANQTIASNWSEGSSAGVSSSDVVNDINNGQTTTINGGRITTGSIGANQVDVNNLFAQNITYTGTITGGTGGSGGLIKSYNGNMVIDLVNGSIYIA